MGLIPKPTIREAVTSEAGLRRTVEQHVPGIAALIKRESAKSKYLALHQNTVAAVCNDDEFLLLGAVVRYAGLHGVQITFICSKQPESVVHSAI